MFRNIFSILLLIVGFAAGYGLFVFLQHKDNVVKQESADVLLEKIKYVSKLVTVEGYFSELYNYKDYWQYDWWPFQRKALIRVKAKVSAGYDLSQMK
ncbi:MAG: DUF4230 domain-containing protein, partial [Saprospiraceae bacterium]|nr:DUF4230 domain-containing protein [Saprospiraceae bacterium]